MSSHLSLSFTPSTPSGASAVTGFVAAAEGTTEGGDVLGGFAAILGGLLAGDAAKILPQAGEATLEAAADGLLEFDAAAEPENVPPPLAAEAPTGLPPEAPKLLADLVDLLIALDTALDAGEPPDPALIAKLDETLDALVGLFGLPAQPQPAAPALTPPALDAEIAVSAAPAASPEAKPSILDQFLDKTQEIAGKLVESGGGIPAKLAAVVQMIAAPQLAPALIAKLGLEAGATLADAGLDLALEALLAPRPEAKPAIAPQPFATPELKLPTLGAAAPGPAATPAAPAGEPAQDAAKVQFEPTVRPKGAPEAQAKPAGQAQPSLPALFEGGGVAPPTAALPQQTALPIHTPAEAKALPAAYHTPQVNLPQIAFEMARQVQAGQSRFQIRLDPPELGRIDVRMDVDAAGNVNARLTVERAETLDLMQRDQRALERALAQAGLDAGKTNLEFSLKQNPFERPHGNSPDLFQPTGGSGIVPETAEPPAITLYRGSASAGGVNIFV